MKFILTILFFFSLAASAQTKIFAINKPVSYPDPPADTTPPVTGRQHILWESTLEGATPFDKYYPLDAASCCAYSVALKSDTVYRGSGAVRFYLFDTNPPVGAGTRSELTPTLIESVPIVDRWFGAAIFLPTPGYNNDTDSSGEDLFQQVHAANGESPAFGIYTLNGRIRIGHNRGTTASPIYTTSETSINYLKNQWVRWVWHCRFAPDATGFCQVWMNDVLIFNYSGPMQYSDVVGGNFYRIGVYKWPWSQGLPSTVHFREAIYDDIRIGDQNATYADVVPRLSD